MAASDPSPSCETELRNRCGLAEGLGNLAPGLRGAGDIEHKEIGS